MCFPRNRAINLYLPSKAQRTLKTSWTCSVAWRTAGRPKMWNCIEKIEISGEKNFLVLVGGAKHPDGGKLPNEQQQFALDHTDLL